MGVNLCHGIVVLLASFCVLLSLPAINGADFFGDLLACKRAGLPPNCNLPVPTTTVPAATPPQPNAPSPGMPPSPANPPGSGPSPPPNQGPGPAGPQTPSPAPPTASPPVPGPAPSPGSEQAAPVVAPTPDTIAPASAPTDSAPAPAPMLLAPAPAPETPQPPPQNPFTLVISAGGSYGDRSSSIYTVSTGIWKSGPNFQGLYGLRNFPMIQLSSTEILAAGKDTLSFPAAQIFSTVTQNWQFTSQMRAARSDNSMVLLPDGSAFTAGGTSNGGTPLASTERYAQGTWTDGPTMGTSRRYFTMLTYVADSQARVLVVGGQDSGGAPIGSCEEWIPGALPASGFEYLQSTLPTPVFNHMAVLLAGRPFIAGGTVTGGASTNAVQMLVNGAWVLQTPMQQGRSNHAMVVLQTGEALVCGGASGQSPLASCEKFNGQTWSPSASLPTPQQNFKMLVLPNGDVLMYGVSVNGGRINSATWTPGAEAWVLIPSSANTTPGAGSGLAGV